MFAPLCLTLRLGVKTVPDVTPRAGTNTSSFPPQLGSPTTRLSLSPVHSSAVKFTDGPTLFTKRILTGSLLSIPKWFFLLNLGVSFGSIRQSYAHLYSYVL